MKNCLQIVVTLFLTSLLVGQTNPVLLRLNPDNSPLPSKKIYCIEIDSSNIIWIGTDSGLAKYDSKSWTIYNTHNGLLSNKITAIAFDKNRNVWIVDSVLSKYDGNTWQHYTNLSNSDIPIGSKFLAVDSNNVKWLVKNERTLVSFDNNNFIEWKKFDTPIQSIVASNDEVWITTQGRLYRLKNDTIEDCSWDINTDSLIPGIQKCVLDNKSNIYVITNIYIVQGDSWNYKNKLYRLKNVNDFENIVLNNKSDYGMINCIAFEKETIWAGIYYYGFVKSDSSNIKVIDGIVAAVSVKVDKNGNKWIISNTPPYNTDVILYNEGGAIYTSVKNYNSETPNSYKLFQNYPNPFNPITKISFSIPAYSHVTLKVFDILGREISILLDKDFNAGKYEVEFDGKDLSCGIYFYTLIANNFVETKKLLLVK